MKWVRALFLSVGIFIAGPLLSGAGVMQSWYEAPKNLSIFFVTLAVFYSAARIFDCIFKFFFDTKEKS